MLLLSNEEKKVLTNNKGKIVLCSLPTMIKAASEVSAQKLIRILQRWPYSKFFAKPTDYIRRHLTSKEDARRHVIDLVKKRGVNLP